MYLLNYISPNVNIDIELKQDKEERQSKKIINDQDQEELAYIYKENDDLEGKIIIKLAKDSYINHEGIKIELIGQIDLFDNSEQSQNRFLYSSKDLEPPGQLTHHTELDFKFRGSNKQYESYYGEKIRVTYMLRVEITLSYFRNPYEETKHIYIILPQKLAPVDNNPVQLEMGYDGYMHFN